MKHLGALTRRSSCCHAIIMDAYPDSAIGSPPPTKSKGKGKVKDKALLMLCTACGKETTRHEVIAEDGTLVWPLHGPTPPAEKRTRPTFIPEEGPDPAVDYHRVWLPGGVKLKTWVKG